jgi:hypothetical protein
LSEKKKKHVGVKIKNEKDFSSLREVVPKERPSNLIIDQRKNQFLRCILIILYTHLAI